MVPFLGGRSIPHTILVRPHPGTKDQAGVNQVHLFYAALCIDDTLHAVKLTVKEHDGKVLKVEEPLVYKLYDQQIEKSMPDGNYTAPEPGGSAPYSASGTDTISIQELLQGVNDVAGRPYFEALDELYQSAFHGWPHRFDRFSAEHIGTGEGGQAFSWGLYFASAKEVDQYCRQELGRDVFPMS